MTRQAAAMLTFNGLVVLFLGLLAGAPYGAALVDGWGDEAARAWKLAHGEGVLNGLLTARLGRLHATEENRVRPGGVVTAEHHEIRDVEILIAARH